MEIEKHSDSSFSERHAAWKSTFCESGYMFMRAEERGTPPPRRRARGRAWPFLPQFGGQFAKLPDSSRATATGRRVVPER